MIVPGSSNHPSVLLNCPNPFPSLPKGFTKKETPGPSDESSTCTHQNLISSKSAGSTFDVEKAEISEEGLNNKFNGKKVITSSVVAPQSIQAAHIFDSDGIHDSSQEGESCLYGNKNENKKKESVTSSPLKVLRNSFRRKKPVIKPSDEFDTSGECSRSSSPNQDWLQIPKPVTRSRSLSRLSDAFSQVQNVCLLPTTKAKTEYEVNLN